MKSAQSIVTIFEHPLLEMHLSRNLKVSVVSVVSGEIIFYAVSKFRVVSKVSGEVTFYLVSKISVVSVVSGEIIFYVVSKISVPNQRSH